MLAHCSFSRSAPRPSQLAEAGGLTSYSSSTAELYGLMGLYAAKILGGTKPADPMLPRDPVARALKLCQDMGRTGCTLYAVDNRVVYVKPAATAQR